MKNPPPSEDELKKALSPEQYEVCRMRGTERAFTGKYVHNKESGMYECVVCGQMLFDSKTKFDSGTGWPSFTDAANSKNVLLEPDETHGMHRVEVKCANCKSHLGHVFDDGPGPTGKRYCINSVALDFKKE